MDGDLIAVSQIRERELRLDITCFVLATLNQPEYDNEPEKSN